jgi:hypothetical protein
MFLWNPPSFRILINFKQAVHSDLTKLIWWDYLKAYLVHRLLWRFSDFPKENPQSIVTNVNKSEM